MEGTYIQGYEGPIPVAYTLLEPGQKYTEFQWMNVRAYVRDNIIAFLSLLIAIAAFIKSFWG